MCVRGPEATDSVTPRPNPPCRRVYKPTAIAAVAAASSRLLFPLLRCLYPGSGILIAGFFRNEAYESTSSLLRAGFRDLITTSKCLLHTTVADMSSLRAMIPASLHRPSSSAPVKSSVSSAICLRSMSSLVFIFRVCTWRISCLPSKSGGGT